VNRNTMNDVQKSQITLETNFSRSKSFLYPNWTIAIYFEVVSEFNHDNTVFTESPT
jgi:hypothetical protein